jgi:hypothetical protein
MGFKEHSTVVVLLVWGNQACWLAPFITHGAAGAVGPEYIGTLVFLVFQDEGSRLYSREECGALNSSVSQEAGLNTEHSK